MSATIRLGTCSFADETLVKAWYPRGVRTGEQRLRYYAERFDTVEIDSSFYRLPDTSTTAAWAERVPEGFVFHVKAFGPMTRHGVRHAALPKHLQELLAADERGRVDRMPRDARALVFDAFKDAVEPLRSAGKLGGILFQLAPYVVFGDRSLEYLEWLRAQMDGYDLLVEFRHQSWFEEENRAETLSFLEQHRLANVIVDAPRSEARNLIPTVVALTTPIAYVRLHGRNAATWNVRGGSAADRFDYLYEDDELREWVEPLREVSRAAEQVFVLANTNARSPDPRGPGFGEIAQGPENALALARVLRDAGLPVSPQPSAQIESLLGDA
ncbi:MAG: DUF72 domain-containing protein [Candidatus Rokuibacteriota bacterium]|nr:MAG: DUF72 domain-containing protein [Candidatus Rokubacteria bacterium]